MMSTKQKLNSTRRRALLYSRVTTPTPMPTRSPGSIRRSLVAKRLVDLVLATLISIVAVPVIALGALIIKITSRGPAFYSQDRVGQYGRVFAIYKLRTMRHNCELLTGPRWSVPGDARITPIGKLFRALHIDELPQLWHVFRGQMSLVGPRPERPEIASRLVVKIPQYDDRSAVLPGITGHAQVYLPPDTKISDVDDKIVRDRQYINRFAAWFDLLTIVRTGFKVVGLWRVAKK